MQATRPINVNVFRYRFPIMAIVSILHRISGVIIFLFLPLMLYFLHQSLISEQSFTALQQLLQTPLIKLAIWIMLSAMALHLLAGIRHMIMDLGFAESVSAGRVTAILVILFSLILMIILGIYLW